MIQIEDVDLNSVEDGTYLGEYSCFPVSVIVEVDIVSHKIVDLTIIKHDNGQGEAAEIIIDNVIDSQSLELDSIAGATYSSRVILLAIEDALIKASN